MTRAKWDGITVPSWVMAGVQGDARNDTARMWKNLTDIEDKALAANLAFMIAVHANPSSDIAEVAISRMFTYVREWSDSKEAAFFLRNLAWAYASPGQLMARHRARFAKEIKRCVASVDDAPLWVFNFIMTIRPYGTHDAVNSALFERTKNTSTILIGRRSEYDLRTRVARSKSPLPSLTAGS